MLLNLAQQNTHVLEEEEQLKLDKSTPLAASEDLQEGSYGDSEQAYHVEHGLMARALYDYQAGIFTYFIPVVKPLTSQDTCKFLLDFPKCLLCVR